MDIFWGRGSALRGKRGCDFLSDQKVTKESLGESAIGPAAEPPGPPCRLPPDPRFTGDALLGTWLKPSGGKNLSGLLSLPPGHWALPGPKLRRSCAEITPPGLAKPWQLVHSCGRIRSAPTRITGNDACLRADGNIRPCFGSSRRGRCPHRPADHGPSPSLAVGAATSRPHDLRRTKQKGRYEIMGRCRGQMGTSASASVFRVGAGVLTGPPVTGQVRPSP